MRFRVFSRHTAHSWSTCGMFRLLMTMPDAGQPALASTSIAQPRARPISAMAGYHCVACESPNRMTRSGLEALPNRQGPLTVDPVEIRQSAISGRSVRACRGDGLGGPGGTIG